MSAAQVVAQFGRPHPLQHRRDGHHVAQRLAHLLAAHRYPTVVHPVAGESIPGGAALRDFVLVVREDQIHSAAMDVEFRPQIGAGHCRAFDMPARTSAPPRRGPRRFAGLFALPQGEVALVTLAGRHTLALMDVVDPVPGQLAVLRVAEHVEVDVAAAGIGVARLDQALHQFDHLADVPGGAGLRRRRQYVQCVIGRGERPLMGGRPLPPRPARRGRLGQNLVFDVRHVADECDVVAPRDQPAAQDVEGHTAADMPDVR